MSHPVAPPPQAHAGGHDLQPAASQGTAGTFVGTPHERKEAGVATAGHKQSFMGQWPGFRGWIGFVWVDVLSMAVLGAISLGVYFADPAPTRNFPITFRDGEIVYPEFAYPLRKNIIPIWAAAMLAFFVPLVCFAPVQIRVKSFDHLNVAVFGLLFSLINAAAFQVFIKWLIGGLRPHFLSVCNPVINTATVGTGFQSIMYTRAVCTGNKKDINDALESMPSGHSTAAFAGFVFLSLYLNGQLKVFSDYRPKMWKLTAFLAPLLGAFLIAASLTVDEYHNWYDCVAGACIGTLCAVCSYRMSYASLLGDFRFTHIPLPRAGYAGGGDRFPYSTGYEPYAAPFAGAWRDGSVSQGAPGDAIKDGGGIGQARQMENIV